MCLFVVCVFSVFDKKSLSHLEYSGCLKREKDISYQKRRIDTQTNKQTDSIKYRVAPQLKADAMIQIKAQENKSQNLGFLQGGFNRRDCPYGVHFNCMD